MDVQNLVLPAAEEAESIWTKKLGFEKMSEERVSALFDTELTGMEHLFFPDLFSLINLC